MYALKTGFIHAAKKSICVFLSVLVLTISFSQMVSASSPEGLNVSGSATYVVSFGHVLVAPGLTLSGGDVESVQVSISANFTSGDYLGIQGMSGASGALSGINWSYNPITGVMDLQNTVAAAAYQGVLRRITYYSTSGTPSSAPRRVSFSVESSLYCAATGHFYEYVASSKSWDEAKTEAAGRSYFGLQGYLATVTSPAENDFIESKLPYDAWMGASDNLTKSEWRWETGPEAGTYFFKETRCAPNSVDSIINGGFVYTSENSTGGGGYAISGLYSNWSDGQPDDYRDYGSVGEYYAHFYKYDWNHINGTWNDYPDDNQYGSGIIQGYVVEYGGMPGDPALQLSGNVTVNIIHPQSVGGEVVQVNKPALLVPWLVLSGLLMIGGTFLVLSRRKRS